MDPPGRYELIGSSSQGLVQPDGVTSRIDPIEKVPLIAQWEIRGIGSFRQPISRPRSFFVRVLQGCQNYDGHDKQYDEGYPHGQAFAAFVALSE